METKVIYEASENLQKELIIHGFSGEKIQEVTIDIPKESILYESVKVTEMGQPYLCFINPKDKNFKYTSYPVLREHTSYVAKVLEKLDRWGDMAETEFREPFKIIEIDKLYIYNDNNAQFDEVPTLQSLEELFTVEVDPLQNAAAKAEAELALAAKIEEAKAEGYQEESSQEMKELARAKKAKKVEQEKQAGVAKLEELKGNITTWAAQHGSELLLARIKDGYEFLELGEKEIFDYILSTLDVGKSPMDTQDLYSGKSSSWAEPTLEAIQFKKLLDEKIKELPGFIEAETKMSIFDIGDSRTTINVYGIELRIFDILAVYVFASDEREDEDDEQY